MVRLDPLLGDTMFLKSAILNDDEKRLAKRAIFLLMIDIQRKQGEISPRERQVLESISEKLGLKYHL